jgi:hypothetical protein
MSIPYNDQWVLGRSRWRRRQRAVLGGALGPPSDPPGRERPEPRDHHERHGPHGRGLSRENRHRRHPGFDPAFTGGAARKPPRWIDRDI